MATPHCTGCYGRHEFTDTDHGFVVSTLAQVGRPGFFTQNIQVWSVWGPLQGELHCRTSNAFRKRLTCTYSIHRGWATVRHPAHCLRLMLATRCFLHAKTLQKGVKILATLRCSKQQSEVEL